MCTCVRACVRARARARVCVCVCVSCLSLVGSTKMGQLVVFFSSGCLWLMGRFPCFITVS